MRQLLFINSILILLFVACSDSDGDVSLTKKVDFKVIDNVVVYDNNSHVAFTCLRKYKNDYYLAFREGTSHVPNEKSEYGKIVLLKLNKKAEWEKIAVLTDDDKDLRDPYLLVKDDKLIIYCGYNQINDSGYFHSGTVYCLFNENGNNTFCDIIHDVPHIIWLWKIREHRGQYYGVGYLETEKPRLMQSFDGIHWNTVSILALNNCSEVDLLFKSDSLFMCIRQEIAGTKSYLGKSCYPFSEIECVEMDVAVASPELCLYPTNNQILLAGREYSFFRENLLDSINVSLFTLETTGRTERLNVFDTGRLGDKGYPSFCLSNDGQVLMSYYTGNSNKSVIKLASLQP